MRFFVVAADIVAVDAFLAIVADVVVDVGAD